MNSKPATNPAKPTKHIAIAIDLDKAVPWHYGCCEGILHYARAQGWSYRVDPLFMAQGSAGEPGGRRSGVSGGSGVSGVSGGGRAYDGVVGRIEAEVAQAARELGVPAVNHWLGSPVKDVPSVGNDNRLAGQMAGEHLLTCGYRRLGYLDMPESSGTRQIQEAMGQVAAGAGLAPPTVCLFDQASIFTESRSVFGGFLDKLDQWLAGLTTPAGLYVGDSTLALYVAQRCKDLGLAVPEAVGIVSKTDDMVLPAISPTLSAVENDWFAVGYQAAAMLDELMQGQTIHPQHRLVPPTRVVVRESTDVFLCEDELVRDARRYIAEHCRQELRVSAVAKALDTSERTLYRKFEEFLGRSIKDEIKRLRVERLKLMVSETTQPLTEIAESFGFSSGTQFARYFNKAVGMNPSAYRKKYGGEGETKDEAV